MEPVLKIVLAYDRIDDKGPLQPNGRAQYSQRFRESEFDKVDLSEPEKEIPYAYSWAIGIHEALGLSVERLSIDKAQATNSSWIYPISPIGAFKHWLFSDDANTLFRHCDRTSLEAIRKSKGYVLIDYSFEGNGFEQNVGTIFHRLHFLIDAYQIPAHKVIFLFGNLKSRYLYDLWAKENAVKDRIHILPINLFETVQYFHQDKSQNESIALEDRNKIFLCLNRQQHAHRIALAMNLFAQGIVEKSFYSFQPEGFHVSSFEHELVSVFGSNFFFKNRDNCQRLIQSLPFVVDSVDLNQNPAFKKFSNFFYNNSRISLVTETTFTGENLFLSEKIYKPIQNNHPFMILSHPGSMSFLRSIGYESFSPIIDETYDEVEDPLLRLEEFTKECLRISRWTTEDWKMNWPRLQEIANHNFENFNQRGEKHIQEFFARIQAIIASPLS